MRIALLGSKGFVGSQLLEQLQQGDTHTIDCYVRGEDLNPLGITYDLVINSSNSAKRHLANSNPLHDFNETVSKTKFIVESFTKSKILSISSISCRTQVDTPYGRNRKISEDLVLQNGGSIVRLGPMFGGNRTQDLLHDIAASRPVFASEETRYGYADVSWIAEYVKENLSIFQGISEITSKNYITLREIAEYIDSKSKFVGENDDQFNSDFINGPDAYDVLLFAKKISI